MHQNFDTHRTCEHLAEKWLACCFCKYFSFLMLQYNTRIYLCIFVLSVPLFHFQTRFKSPTSSQIYLHDQFHTRRDGISEKQIKWGMFTNCFVSIFFLWLRIFLTESLKLTFCWLRVLFNYLATSLSYQFLWWPQSTDSCILFMLKRVF